MSRELERIRTKARYRFTEEQRQPWEHAWARVFEALPDFCEDVEALKIQMLAAALDGQSVADVERDMIALVRTVPPCPVPPPCPV